MAIRTFDLTVRDMDLVHGLGGMFRGQGSRPFVTLEALAFRDVAVSDNDIHMASLTGHASCNIFAVIEVPAFDLDVSFGFNMARGAAPHSAGDALLPSSRAGPIKVTDDAVGFMNGEVGSLDELSMTACASKSHPPFQFNEMAPVGESYIFKDHLSFQILYSVTSFLQTISIIHFIMELPGAFADEEIGQSELKV
jgi:hypothetical protein